jgi:hypothetical protein
MLSKQMLHLTSILPDPPGDMVPSGMFLASIAIGMAPAVAAVGLLFGAGLFAIVGSGCVLGAGLMVAVVASDR